MSAVNVFHNDAMDYAEMAFLAERKGEDDNATRFFVEALRYEKRAIEAMADFGQADMQPSYSVLCRSAAELALKCGRFATADSLCRRGLSAEGCPPEIEDELLEAKRVAVVALDRKGGFRGRRNVIHSLADSVGESVSDFETGASGW